LLLILDAVETMEVVDADFIREAYQAAMSGEDAAEFDRVIRTISPVPEPALQ
jgi:hypothetical protein